MTSAAKVMHNVHDYRWVVLSVVISILTGGHPTHRRLRAACGVFLRGSANPVMDYTAMATMSVTYATQAPDLSRAVRIESLGLLGTSVVPVMVLVVALLTSLVDRLHKQRDLAQRSFEELRALAGRLQQVREEERTMVAREIHDELGQALTSVKIDSAALMRDLPVCEQALADARRRDYTRSRPRDRDLPHLSGDAHQYRAPRQSTAVDVALARDADTLILTVQDNGVGIDLAGAASRRSLGIVGMRERALLLGGELTIRGLGKGTTVTVRIPDS